MKQLPLIAQGTIDRFFVFPLLDGGPFVVELFPAAAGDLHFDKAAFQIHPERDEGESFFLGKGVELFDLPFVKEQLPIAPLFMVEEVAKAIGSNRCVLKDHFTMRDEDVRVLQAATVAAEGFDLSSEQADTRFPSVEDFVLIRSFSIGYEL